MLKQAFLENNIVLGALSYKSIIYVKEFIPLFPRQTLEYRQTEETHNYPKGTCIGKKVLVYFNVCLLRKYYLPTTYTKKSALILV